VLANMLYLNQKGKRHGKKTSQNYLATVGLCLGVAADDDSTTYGKARRGWLTGC